MGLSRFLCSLCSGQKQAVQQAGAGKTLLMQSLYAKCSFVDDYNLFFVRM